jgi:hypothetical protein
MRFKITSRTLLSFDEETTVALDENIKTHPEEMSWTAYALVNKVINLLVS